MSDSTSPKSALGATFATAEFSLLGQQPGPTSHSFPQSPVIYRGEPLFCNASSAGGTLSIIISETQQQTLGKMSPAQLADVSVTYQGFSDHFTQPINYTAKGRLTFRIKLDSNLANLHVVIGEDDGSIPENDKRDGKLRYVLVQEGNPPSPVSMYDVYWILGDKDDLLITNFRNYPTGGVVFPPPPAGGIAGPMGLFTP